MSEKNFREIDEFEKSLSTTYRRGLWSRFVKGLKEYKMLEPGDRVCVCISGGKDSMCLAKLFMLLQRHSDFDFEVEFLVMDPGYNKKNFDLIKKNIETLKIPAKFVKNFAGRQKHKNQILCDCNKKQNVYLCKLAKSRGDLSEQRHKGGVCPVKYRWLSHRSGNFCPSAVIMPAAPEMHPVALRQPACAAVHTGLDHRGDEQLAAEQVAVVVRPVGGLLGRR